MLGGVSLTIAAGADGTGDHPRTMIPAIEPFLVSILTFNKYLTIAGFPTPHIHCEKDEGSRPACVLKMSPKIFAHDLPQDQVKHSFISAGKTLTQDKLADCEVCRVAALCAIANINSVGLSEAPRDQCADLSGRPVQPQCARGPSASWVAAACQTEPGDWGQSHKSGASRS